MDLVFDRHGEGEPLLLLHGLGSRRQAFDPLLPHLGGFAVWAVDLPGFGASPALPGRTDVTALTDAVGAFLDEHGIERPHVAGNSTGGGVALELAARDAVASACALAPIGFWSSRERAFCQASTRATRGLSRVARPVIPAVTRSALGRTALAAQYFARPWHVDADALVQDVDALIGASAFDDVNASFTGYIAPTEAADHVPVTIVWGAQDRLLLPRQLRRARRRLPKARHVLLRGCGHLMMADDPEAVAGVVRAATRAPAPAPAPA